MNTSQNTTPECKPSPAGQPVRTIFSITIYPTVNILLQNT